jgi:hypothetical protein
MTSPTIGDGTPLAGDRSAIDATDFPLLHTNDTDAALTAIHHTLGTGANQSAAGNHGHALLHNPVTLDANADTILSLSTQALGLDVQMANRIFAGPVDDSNGDCPPTFRALVPDDIPTLSPEIIGDGDEQYQTIITGASPFTPEYSGFLLDGTTGGKTKLSVTNLKTLELISTDDRTLTVAGNASVSGTNTGDISLAASASVLMDLSGQAISLDTQTANYALMGPTTGAAAAPTFRALVAADVIQAGLKRYEILQDSDGAIIQDSNKSIVYAEVT